jgi:hypothetical protein
MRHRIFAVAVAAAAVVAVAAPAAATEPIIVRNVTVHNVVSDPAACGDFGVTWDINLVADVTTFFDADGVRVRQAVHIREDNTVTNTVTGLTLREGPDAFMQTTYFLPGGAQVDRITATGLQARVGNDLRDVGRVVLVPLGGGAFDLAFAAGPHPVREAADDSTITDALAAFCDILA